MSSAQGAGKKRRPRYDDEYRASAVLMLEAAGYPDRKGALATVSSHLHMPAATLSRWGREKQNPPPTDLVSEKRLDLVAELTDLLGLSLKAAKDTVGEATYRELMTGVGILVDKVQLLTGQATARAEVGGPNGGPVALRVEYVNDWRAVSGQSLLPEATNDYAGDQR